jgi:hypothetical protein
MEQSDKLNKAILRVKRETKKVKSDFVTPADFGHALFYNDGLSKAIYKLVMLIHKSNA